MDAKQFEEKDVFAFRDAGWYVASSRMNPLGDGYRQVVTLERDVTKAMLEDSSEPAVTTSPAETEIGTPSRRPAATPSSPASRPARSWRASPASGARSSEAYSHANA